MPGHKVIYSCKILKAETILTVSLMPWSKCDTLINALLCAVRKASLKLIPLVSSCPLTFEHQPICIGFLIVPARVYHIVRLD